MTVRLIPIATILFISGDFNAMLQSGDGPVLFSPNTTENQNAYLLIDFINSHDLVPANTLFRKNLQYSFYGPNHRKVLLDYILIRKKWWKSVSNCDIRCVASVASDHNLLKARVKWKLKNNKKLKSNCPYLLSCLKNPECAKSGTSFVIEKYSLSCTTDNQHNYSLFSRLAQQAISEFVPVKDKVIKRKPCEESS